MSKSLQRGLVAAYLIPIAMECGPTKGSTQVAEKPATGSGDLSRPTIGHDFGVRLREAERCRNKDSQHGFEE